MHTDDHALELQLTATAPGDAAGAAVRSAALHAGVSAAAATRLRAVVEELVREARRREPVSGEHDIVVRAGCSGGRFGVEVRDRRLPLAPGESRALPSRRLAALGFVQGLHISNQGADGNVAAIHVERHDAADDGLGLDAVEQLDARAQRVSDDEAAQLEIRPMVPADAPGVARCVYRCYGYSYLDPAMYRPRRLVTALRSGLLHSVVAVDPGGEVVGHCSLSFDRRGDAVPEGGKLVVDPRYRGHHLAERLAQLRKEVAAELGVPGIWFECVTNHAFSQKEVLAGGGAETGLLIGATPAAVHMEALDNVVGGRHCLLTMWSPVEPSSSGATLHPGSTHVELLERVVGLMGLDRSVVEPAGAAATLGPARGRSELHSSVSPSTGIAHLRVGRIGSDLCDRVTSEIDGLGAFDVAAVHLDLDLTDPACAGAGHALERLGFCWGAWLPELDQGADVLRLQRVLDPHVPIEGISCARPEGEAVRDLVLDQWRRVRTRTP